MQKVLLEAGIPASATLTEARGLRGKVDRTRPGDIVVLDYHAPGRHLLVDGVVTTVYRNTRQRETGDIPGYAAKLVEDRKFYADKTSERPVARIHGGLHTLVPFAVEDGGRLGAHAHALLRMLAERAVREGRRSRPPYATTTGMWHEVMELHKCPFGSSAGSATSLHGYTSPCPGSYFGSSAPSKQWRTSTPREI